jgi:hypothetical protein
MGGVGMLALWPYTTFVVTPVANQIMEDDSEFLLRVIYGLFLFEP